MLVGELLNRCSQNEYMHWAVFYKMRQDREKESMGASVNTPINPPAKPNGQQSPNQMISALLNASRGVPPKAKRSA